MRSSPQRNLVVRGLDSGQLSALSDVHVDETHHRLQHLSKASGDSPQTGERRRFWTGKAEMSRCGDDLIRYRPSALAAVSALTIIRDGVPGTSTNPHAA